MRRSNCLFFAIWLWVTRGGYLVIRKSNFGRFPHFIWVKKLGKNTRMLHYTTDEKDKEYSLFFHGKILRHESKPPQSAMT